MSLPEPSEVLYERRCAKYVYVVPEGLRELMTDISREVLRHNPVQVYCFITEYLDSLLITRENARVAAKLVENLTETSIIIAELFQETGITRHEADRAARIIQRAFRRHSRGKTAEEPLEEEDLLEKIIRKTKVSFEEADRAVGVIQRAYRYYKSKKQDQDDGVDWRQAAKRTIGILDKVRCPKAELDRAATLIKAAYKGYYMRKNMQKLLASAQAVQNEVFQAEEMERINNEILNHAATVIQRCYRAYAARQRALRAKTDEIEFYAKYEEIYGYESANIMEDDETHIGMYLQNLAIDLEGQG
ncbi:Radial spoke binding protein 15 [Carabus blaptoides fortunei]